MMFLCFSIVVPKLFSRTVLLKVIFLFGLLVFSTPAEGMEKIVKKITVFGIEKRTLPSLYGKIRLAVGKPFSSTMLAMDIKRLYKSNRFFQVRTRVLPYEGGIKIEFFLKERPRIQRVILSGRSELELGEIVKIIRSKKGSFYSPAFVKRDKKKILELYQKEGYYFAEIISKTKSLPKNKIEILFLIQEGPFLELYDMEIVGNKNFSDSQLIQYFQNSYMRSFRHMPFYFAWIAYVFKYQIFWWLSEDTYKVDLLEKDMDTLRTFYRGHGYFDAIVTYDQIEFYHFQKRAKVTFRVQEGSRYRVDKIFLELNGQAVLGKHGTKEEKLRFLQSKISLQEGKYFSGEMMSKDLQALRKEYFRKAYIESKVDMKMKFKYTTNSLNVIYSIQEGRKIRIEKISFKGNYRTKDQVIRRYLTFYPGEWFDGDKLEDSNNKINSTRFFKKFDPKMEPGSQPDTRNLIFEVEEGRTGSFIFGGGLASDFGFFGNFQFVQKNFDITDLPKSFDDFFSGNGFVGGGQLLKLTIQPGINLSNYSLSFREPFLMGYPIIFSTNAFFYNRNQFDYTEERLGGSITFGKRFGDNAIVEGTYEYQRINIFDLPVISPQDLLDVEGHNLLSAFTVSGTYNRLKVDRKFIAYGGYKLSASYQYAGNFFLGDFDFSKANARGQSHFWVFGSEEYKNVLSLKLSGGWEEANGNSSSVPIFDRFFLGGVYSLRGFRFRGIGPRSLDVSLGGTVMVYGTAEYAFPLLGNFMRGLLFADVGKLASGIKDMEKSDFRISIGLGLRIRIPAFPAPVQLYFGFPQKSSFGDERQTFQFNLGFNF